MRLRYWTALAAAICLSVTLAVRDADHPSAHVPVPADDAQSEDGPAPEVAAGNVVTAPVQSDLEKETQPPKPLPWSRAIGPGENLDILLAEAGLDALTRAEVSRVIGSEYDLRRLKPGYRLSLEIATDGTPRSATLEVQDGVRVHAAFGAVPAVETIAPELETVVRAGEAEIASSIYSALEAAGIPTRFATDLQLILDGTLDLRRELGGGERLRVFWRENRLADRVIGEPVIDFAQLDLGDERYDLLWPDDTSRRSMIYRNDRLVRVFHQPIRGARLSSAFGLREHPVHGGIRMHSGVDFAADLGSAVHATQSGKIAFMGRRSGYGLMVEIEHQHDARTIYAHLSATNEMIEAGQSISEGAEIGSVGSTGTSTAPHLHYEIIIEGRPVAPLTDERLLQVSDERPDIQAARNLLERARNELVRVIETRQPGSPREEG